MMQLICNLTFSIKNLGCGLIGAQWNHLNLKAFIVGAH